MTMMKMYVEACVNWLLPFEVSFRAIPKALVAMTETDPVAAQTER